MPPVPQPQVQVQTQQSLQHLESLAQALLTSCNSMSEMLRVQVEETKALREVIRKMEEREARRDEAVQGTVLSGSEGMGGKEKAGLAKEILSATGVSEEVREAATNHLKRLFQ